MRIAIRLGLVLSGLLLLLVPAFSKTKKNGMEIHPLPRAEPTIRHLYYGPKADEWLNLYLVKTDKPVPLLIWSHANTATADQFSDTAWKPLREAGISALSWESVPNLKTEAQVTEALADGQLLMTWIFSNAEKYHFDTNALVAGGQSRGTGLSWDLSRQKPGLIKGLYFLQGLPSGFWEGGWDFTRDVVPQSPPIYFLYRENIDTTDQHTPKNAVTISNTYAACGIGNRITLRYAVPEDTDVFQPLVACIKAWTK